MIQSPSILNICVYQHNEQNTIIAGKMQVFWVILVILYIEPFNCTVVSRKNPNPTAIDASNNTTSNNNNNEQQNNNEKGVILSESGAIVSPGSQIESSPTHLNNGTAKADIGVKEMAHSRGVKNTSSELAPSSEQQQQRNQTAASPEHKEVAVVNQSIIPVHEDESKSAEVAKPADSSKIVDSSRSAKLSLGADSTKPVDSSKTADLSRTADSSKSQESSKKADSSKSADLSKYADSPKSADLSKTADSFKSANLSKTADSFKITELPKSSNSTKTATNNATAIAPPTNQTAIVPKALESPKQTNATSIVESKSNATKVVEHHKPTSTFAIEDDPELLKKVQSFVLEPEPMVESVREMDSDGVFESRAHSSYSEFLWPAIGVIVIIPLLVIFTNCTVHRVRDYWSKRKYFRVDYLIEDMYN